MVKKGVMFARNGKRDSLPVLNLLFSRSWHVWKLVFPLQYEKTPAVVFKVGNVPCLGRHSSRAL